MDFRINKKRNRIDLMACKEFFWIRIRLWKLQFDFDWRFKDFICLEVMDQHLL